MSLSGNVDALASRVAQEINALRSASAPVVLLTQAAYDALGTKDPDTLYVIRAATSSTRKNWNTNPALKNDVTGYFGNSVTRVTNATGLPRATALDVPVAGDISCPRFAVTPGEVIRLSGHVKAVGADRDIFYQIHFRQAGDVWGGASADANTVVASGASQRLATAAVTVPDLAVDAMLFFNVPGAVQITGLLYERSGSLGSYFDGDTSGAVWDGANGNSTSTLTTTS